MVMTTTVTLTYEGPPSCLDCQRAGIPLCAHIGFHPEAWHVHGRAVHVPGLDDGYTHVIQHVEISGDRKTLALTVSTDRPALHDLARHLSMRPDVRAKAAVRAVHHATGDTLEEGAYDRFLHPGDMVAIDRAAYHVHSVEHPNRDPATGTATDVDLQIARLIPVDPPTVRPVDPEGGSGGAA